ncbi:MAG: orotidine-5'-phosphate decarboxylase, partial [Spirochaetota bacterium]
HPLADPAPGDLPGDIGTTSAAYAKESFEFFGADAVTLAPYMGFDSISPFVSGYSEKGYYLLCRTSNKTAVDFQNLKISGSPLYIEVAKKICEWDVPGLGAVTGATYPGELEEIEKTFAAYGKNIPLLIPGIGSQGGDVNAIVSILKKYGDIRLHRINSSSGIIFAHEKEKGIAFQKAAVNELEKLNMSILSAIKD